MPSHPLSTSTAESTSSISPLDMSVQEQLRRVHALGHAHQALKKEIAKRIVGQQALVDDLLTAVFAQGHALLIGVPGLAKTLLVRTLSQVMDLSFQRIQFTPDLMPADITGTEVLEEDRATGKRTFRFVAGPVFGQIVLADEINRTPPKTQAALLQAMQERSVSVNGVTHPLPAPFFVLATQNPIEQEGTYPLPEAQLDRFMFALKVGYPSAAEELAIAKTTTGTQEACCQKLLDAEQVLALQYIVKSVAISDQVAGYAVKLARASRPEDPSAPPAVKQFVSWGAGPRAVQYLVLGAKAKAVLAGTTNVACEHVRQVAPLVLRHRILINFAGEAQGLTSDKLIDQLIGEISDSPASHASL